MAKLFFDHLIEFEEIEVELKNADLTSDEKQELGKLIDSMVHHRVIGRVLKHLPKSHHEEFLNKFHKTPYDPALLSWIDQRIESSVERHIREEVKTLKAEILEDLKSQQKTK